MATVEERLEAWRNWDKLSERQRGRITAELGAPDQGLHISLGGPEQARKLIGDLPHDKQFTEEDLAKVQSFLGDWNARLERERAGDYSDSFYLPSGSDRKRAVIPPTEDEEFDDLPALVDPVTAGVDKYGIRDAYRDPEGAAGVGPGHPIEAPAEPEDFSLTDLPKVWANARDLYSSTAALARYNYEQSLKADPEYNLQDLDQLLADVPDQLKPALQDELTNAVSGTHAQYIKARFLEETHEQQQLMKYGAAVGISASLAAGVADEGAILMSLATNPAVAATQKLTRLKRAIRLALLSGAENAVLEAGLAEASKTSGPEDIAYAFMFGGAIGGGIGAIFRGKPNSPVKERIRREMADYADKQADEIDKAYVADALNKAPDPLPRESVARQIIEADIAETNAHAEVSAPTPEASPQATIRVKRSKAKLAAQAEARKAEAVTPEPPELGARRTRLDELQARFGELAAEDIPAPKAPRVLDMVDATGKAIDDFAAVRADPGADIKAKTNADRKANTAKREFLTALKESAPDLFAKLPFGRNPKLAEFQTWLKGDGRKVLAKVKKQHEADRAEYEKALDKADAELDKVKKEIADTEADIKRLTPAPTVRKAKTISANDAAIEPDLRDAGAAEVGTTAKDLGTFDEATEEWMRNYPRSNTKLRYDIHATGSRSPNEMIRVLTDMLTGDPVGKEGHRGTGISATELAEQFLNAGEAIFQKVANRRYIEWLKEQKLGLIERWKPSRHKEFMRQVTEEVEFGGSQSEHVRATANAMRKALEFWRAAAEKGGVEKFDQIKQSKDYVPHLLAWDKVTMAAQRWSWRKTPDGMKNPLEELVRRSVRSAQPGIDDVLARRIAAKYVATIRRRASGLGGRLLDLQTTDLKYMRGILEEIELEADGVDYVMNLMTRAATEGKRGQGRVTARAKSRLLMDVSETLEVLDRETGETKAVSMRDLMERDADRLVGSYGRSVGGLAAIAQRTKGTPFHIRSRRDFDQLVNRARFWEEDNVPGVRKAVFGNKDQVDVEVENLETLWNRATGRPLVDPLSGVTIWRRRLGNWNFVRVMNQVFFAQAAETGNMLSFVGMHEMRQQIPALVTMRRDALNGKPDAELAAVLEDFLALGTDRERHSIAFKWDEDTGGLAQQLNGTDFVLHELKNITSWPMQKMLGFQQRLTSMGLMQRFANYASGQRKWTPTDAERYRELGLNEAMRDRIFDQFRQHATDRKGGTLTRNGVLGDPHFEAWDMDVRDALLGAIYKHARRIIQENDIGSVHKWMNTNLGAFLSQFRSFVAVAHSLQMLHNVHMRDRQAFWAFMFSGALAGMSYTMQTSLNSLGRPDGEKYRKERLSWDRIAKAAYQRSALTGISSMLVDFGADALGAGPVFQGRSTGLGTGFGGIPTVDAAKQLYGGVQGVSRSIFDSTYNFSQQDYDHWIRLLPLYNYVGVGNALQAIGGIFPEKSQDRRAKRLEAIRNH